MSALNQDANRALAARGKLQEAVSMHSLSQGQVANAVDALNGAIDSVVQMNIRSSEGDVQNEAKLHMLLAYLVADVELSYTRPTQAQYAVFRDLDQRAKVAEQKLEAAVAKADQLVKPTALQ